MAADIQIVAGETRNIEGTAPPYVVNMPIGMNNNPNNIPCGIRNSGTSPITVTLNGQSGEGFWFSSEGVQRETIEVQVAPGATRLWVYLNTGGAKGWQPYDQGLHYLGAWVGGQNMPLDQVTDDGYLAVANKYTTDKPAPVATGDPSWSTDRAGGLPPWSQTQVSVSQVIAGHRYAFTEAFDVQSVRHWIVYEPSTTFTLFLVIDPLGVPEYRELLPEFTPEPGDAGRWIDLPIGNNIIPAGITFDLLQIIRSKSGANTFVGDWDYIRTDATDPVAGEINHSNNGALMYVNEIDDGATNRTADLDTVDSGDLISAGGLEWDVVSATKTLDVYEFAVTPNTRLSAGVYTFTFTTYGTTPITYVHANNFWLSTPQANGVYLDSGNYPGDATISENAHGVDILMQDLSLSEDWDLIGSGSAGSASPAVDTVSPARVSFVELHAFECLGFDGVNQYIAMTQPAANSSLSVSQWIRSSQAVAHRFLQNRGSGSWGSTRGFQCSINPANNNYGNTGVDATGGNFINFTSIPFAGHDGLWHLFIMTYDTTTGTGRIYWDGTEIGVQTNAAMIGQGVILGTAGLEFGRANQGSQYYAGDAYGVMLYPRVLTVTEIQEMYKGNNPTDAFTDLRITSNLLGPKDYGSGGNDGTLPNGGTWKTRL